MHIRLTLEYDGTRYCGWQLQAGPDSVQATVEAALQQIFSEKIRTRAAGRTDAGVHARGQVAAMRLPRPFEPAALKRALNALLPADIVVLDAVPATAGFDPRRDARSRVYEYRVLNQPLRSAFEFRHTWLVGQALDLEALNVAASAFIGEHDFAAFRALGSEERSTIRRVLVSRWRREQSELIYHVEATAFLRHMVRTMVAAMVNVGRGAASPGLVAELLADKDRARAPAAAPARGLCLVEVRY